LSKALSGDDVQALDEIIAIRSVKDIMYGF
jgi:hypothetical protein